VIPFDGMKVFSTTLARDREVLGENITKWIQDNSKLEIRRQGGHPELRQGVPLPHRDPLL